MRLWPGRRGRKPAQPPHDDGEWESREAFLDRLNAMRDAAEQREAFDKYVAKHSARKRARRSFWRRQS